MDDVNPIPYGLKVSYAKTNRIHMHSTSSYEAFVNCAKEGCELLENQLDRVLQQPNLSSSTTGPGQKRM
jgi:hypothetical protein